MRDPLDKAVAKTPPTIGSGCTQRFDPDSLSPEDGTEFPDAELLWRRMQRLDEEGPRADDSSNEP
ncbi:hypothetical protein [Stutzerimonas nitrititolerans]|uniref:hypothetical protein n=1 Tax=Stutzerimonas nitrititolerans TaxID=2482751 RepID=UPI0028984DC0|nr:hypothetical protein [Stutzerimonas nitrititolerans]